MCTHTYLYAHVHLLKQTLITQMIGDAPLAKLSIRMYTMRHRDVSPFASPKESAVFAAQVYGVLFTAIAIVHTCAVNNALHTCAVNTALAYCAGVHYCAGMHYTRIHLYKHALARMHMCT